MLNKSNKTPYKPLFFVLLISFFALGAMIYLNLNDAQRTVPKIKLSYFKSSDEFAQAMEQRLHLELTPENHIWLGVEPELNSSYELALSFKAQLEKIKGPFDVVILDQELNWKPQLVERLRPTHTLQVKEQWSQVAELVQQNRSKKILVLTASIYTTNFAALNPIHKIKEALQYKPITFSMGYFAIDLEDEKNSVFTCKTEDKSGVSDFSCVVINKARTQKRKINLKKITEEKLIMGLMDLSGEKDYLVLIK